MGPETVILFALVGGLFSSGALDAQTVALHGRVIDPAGEPVAGQNVVLHRVTDAGGASVAEATSGPDGSFELALAGAEDGAVYFAATRYDGDLHIGTPFRLPVAADAEYVIVVGAGAALPGGHAPPTAAQAAEASAAADGSAWFWILAAAVAVALGWFGRRWLAARRVPERRALLLELAALEERLDSRGDGLGPEERETSRRRRDTLRERLRGAPAG